MRGFPRTVVLICLVCATAGVACDPSSERPEPDVPAAGGVPLDDRWLAFVKSDGVYVARADGSQERRITRSIPGFEYQPDWSPDGRKLLLRVDQKELGGVWVVNANGSHALNLSRVSGIPGGVPDWTPDGRVVFIGKAEAEPTFGVYIMEADGKHPVRLTPDRWEAQYPAVSPSGRRIAFTRLEGTSFDIWSMNLDGSDLTRLTEDPASDNWAEWSPDGSRIVFHSTRRVSDGALHLMDADGSDERFLTPGGEPAWSPDGRWIAYDCFLPDGIIGVCAIRPDGSGRTALFGGAEVGFPAWRPTGATL